MGNMKNALSDSRFILGLGIGVLLFLAVVKTNVYGEMSFFEFNQKPETEPSQQKAIQGNT